MKINRILSALSVIFCLSIFEGCAYHGAVFSEGTHVGIQVKADRQQGIPVEMNVGYDHAMVAVVPKNDIDGNGDRGAGEVGSLVARNEVIANPPRISEVAIDKTKVFATVQSKREKNVAVLRKLSTTLSAGKPTTDLANALLRADTVEPVATYKAKYDWEPDPKRNHILRARTYLISGAGAVVATVPGNPSVEVRPAGADKDEEGYTIRTSGDASQRVSSALSTMQTGYTPALLQWNALTAEINGLLSERQDAIYRVSSAILGDAMLNFYNIELAKSAAPVSAFHFAGIKYQKQEGLTSGEWDSLKTSVVSCVKGQEEIIQQTKK